MRGSVYLCLRTYVCVSAVCICIALCVKIHVFENEFVSEMMQLGVRCGAAAGVSFIRGGGIEVASVEFP